MWEQKCHWVGATNKSLWFRDNHVPLDKFHPILAVSLSMSYVRTGQVGCLGLYKGLHYRRSNHLHISKDGGANVCRYMTSSQLCPWFIYLFPHLLAIANPRHTFPEENIGPLITEPSTMSALDSLPSCQWKYLVTMEWWISHAQGPPQVGQCLLRPVSLGQWLFLQ
jgi:hypothetical protein